MKDLFFINLNLVMMQYQCKRDFIDQLEKPVAFWKNALLDGVQRNHIVEKENQMDALISLPDKNKKGEWSKKYDERLKEASNMLQICDSVAEKIKTMQSKTVRNNYTLQVYAQVNNLVRFSPEILMALKKYDESENKIIEEEVLKEIKQLAGKFKAIRNKMEQVYVQTRILEKPNGYVLDQDHHYHLANQSLSFDWQFNAELLFLKRIGCEFN